MILLLEGCRVLLLIAGIYLFVAILYLSILSVSALVTSRKWSAANTMVQAVPATNFALLIPAHNEELTLGILLKNLCALAYPKDLYTIYVVADNCTDGTAHLARVAGVRVYERFNSVQRGKGYALNWLLRKLEEDQLIYDAYVVVDADSVLDAHFLQCMARELVTGAHALQARNTVLNGVESPSAALRWIALSLVNHVRPLGRNGLGASSSLTGNGMCFSRDIMLRCPWQAFSVGEDYEYYLTLVNHGQRVKYVPDAIVRSVMPIKFAQMRTQDIRWEAAPPAQNTWRTAWKLLHDGLRLRDFVRLDACIELLVPPLSLLVSSVLLFMLASIVLWLPVAIGLSCVISIGLIFYISTAFYLLRPPGPMYRALLYAPSFVIWKVWVYMVLRRNKRLSSEWVRTSRTISIK